MKAETTLLMGEAVDGICTYNVPDVTLLAIRGTWPSIRLIRLSWSLWDIQKGATLARSIVTLGINLVDLTTGAMKGNYLILYVSQVNLNVTGV